MSAPTAQREPAHGAATVPPPVPTHDTWMLQGAAAAAAGCSVSAIRKWRRVGLVADRTRISPGGMRRVEVRLEDVLARMRASMPRSGLLPTSMPPSPLGPEQPGPGAEQSAVAVVPIGDLDVFVQHIAEAERRAAQAEARSQAKDAVIEFLRERVADLEAQVQTAATDQLREVGASSGPTLDPKALTAEIRELRARFQARPSDAREDVERRNAIRQTYDTALICLCVAAGIPSTFTLGESLTGPERRRLAHALLKAGFDIVG